MCFEAGGSGACRAFIPIDLSIMTRSKMYWWSLPLHPWEEAITSHDNGFDLVYEYVKEVIDYDKPKVVARVSNFFDM